MIMEKEKAINNTVKLLGYKKQQKENSRYKGVYMSVLTLE